MSACKILFVTRSFISRISRATGASLNLAMYSASFCFSILSPETSCHTLGTLSCVRGVFLRRLFLKRVLTLTCARAAVTCNDEISKLIKCCVSKAIVTFSVMFGLSIALVFMDLLC